MKKVDYKNATIENKCSFLPQRPSLLPTNSLGALLLDFRASLKSLGLEGQDLASANDFEKVLAQLSSADAQALNKDLEDIAPNLFAYFSRDESAQRGLVGNGSVVDPKTASEKAPDGDRIDMGAPDFEEADDASFWQARYTELFASYQQITQQLLKLNETVSSLKAQLSASHQSQADLEDPGGKETLELTLGDKKRSGSMMSSGPSPASSTPSPSQQRSFMAGWRLGITQGLKFPGHKLTQTVVTSPDPLTTPYPLPLPPLKIPSKPNLIDNFPAHHLDQEYPCKSPPSTGDQHRERAERSTSMKQYVNHHFARQNLAPISEMLPRLLLPQNSELLAAVAESRLRKAGKTPSQPWGGVFKNNSLPSRLHTSGEQRPCESALGKKQLGRTTMKNNRPRVELSMKNILPEFGEGPLPSPFANQQEGLLRSIGSFPELHVSQPDDCIQGHDGHPSKPDASSALTVCAETQGVQNSGPRVETERHADAPTTCAASDAVGAMNAPTATPGGNMTIQMSSRLSLPVLQILKLLRQVAGGIHLEADDGVDEKDAVARPSPQSWDSKMLGSEGVVASHHHVLNKEGASDKMVGCSTPFCDEHFATAAATGMNLSPMKQPITPFSAKLKSKAQYHDLVGLSHYVGAKRAPDHDRYLSSPRLDDSPWRRPSNNHDGMQQRSIGVDEEGDFSQVSMRRHRSPHIEVHQQHLEPQLKHKRQQSLSVPSDAQNQWPASWSPNTDRAKDSRSRMDLDVVTTDSSSSSLDLRGASRPGPDQTMPSHSQDQGAGVRYKATGSRLEFTAPQQPTSSGGSSGPAHRFKDRKPHKGERALLYKSPSGTSRPPHPHMMYMSHMPPMSHASAGYYPVPTSGYNGLPPLPPGWSSLPHMMAYPPDSAGFSGMPPHFMEVSGNSSKRKKQKLVSGSNLPGLPFGSPMTLPAPYNMLGYPPMPYHGKVKKPKS
ncbi:hypothetical protein CEUSTIGMA_g6908.t1 [Chlamydomonas eustigma]|uniref:Uncharacterized protein n=1 Tax=Chlamydomonas eustigma TaxID=1157962 RepID=A0A250X8T2_9CHLO|nr:hypothetical protein CEUSTIGMA_g6908.t1 [Chlamydomonas eustigma]|eukprot:GAX79467.1 hypothetical protein CEUSTIGMA_g6908.t1 [Chlamydomonas eustigma]